MPAIVASAPGKTILVGEHSVVYNRPAIAVPVHQVRAKASVFALPKGQPDQIVIFAPGINLKANLSALPNDHPFAIGLHQLKAHLGLSHFPSFEVHIHSTIPRAGGLGSSAAVSVALIRAVAQFLGKDLPNEEINQLAYMVEKRHHGTPSGIDNTVITYAQPIFFIRDIPFEKITVKKPFTLVIGNSGVEGLTAKLVAEVRARRENDFELYETIFDQIGGLVLSARQSIETGELNKLGTLMTENHTLLQKIGVSCPELDHLVDAAISAGACGAKLSGGGGGGNMIALVNETRAEQVCEALKIAGAVTTISTQILSSSPSIP